MERERKASVFIWFMAIGLLFEGLLVPVMSVHFEDQKHYYSPDPNAGTPPSGSHGSPPHGSTPSHGGGYGGSPPSHHGTPSHGGGYKPTPSSPPSSCGNPPHEPSTPTPSTPSNPPSGGGGYYSPPSGGGSPPYDGGSPPYDGGSPPSDGGSPPSGGGGYYSPPSGGGSPPYDGGSPPYGGGSPPVIVSPPYDPGTPSVPTPPYSNIPGTCTYWSTHPTLIWGLLGWWGSLGNAFGVASVPGFGSNMSLQQALSNTRTDGYGALYREGTASWLNSLVNHRFPFTTDRVRQSFVAALHSNKAAGAQAQLFKLANEGRLKPGA